ncbi:MAG: hypothetical protein ACP5XB_26530 [Isosphaeraceae bacterium]
MTYDRTLIQIRERSFLDLMDLALLVVRRRPGKLLLAAAIGIIPLTLLNCWMFSNYWPAPLLDNDPTNWLLVLFLEAPWATAPLTVMLGGLMFDRPPKTLAFAERVVRALPSFILVHVLLRGVLGITFFLLPIIPGRLWFASEVILLERTGGFKALRRCSQLSTDRFGPFFRMAVAQLGFGVVFVLCFWVGTGAITSTVFKRSLTWEAPSFSAWSIFRLQLGVWTAIAFFSIARFLIYIDQRIRAEGWELKLRLQTVGRELAEGRS